MRAGEKWPELATPGNVQLVSAGARESKPRPALRAPKAVFGGVREEDAPALDGHPSPR